jgi:hypothetical protein
VRFGYSPARLRDLAQSAGLEVTDEGFISGIVSQQLTNLMRRLAARLGGAPAWALLLALRPLAVLDGPLTRLLGYPHLSVALQAVKPG